MLQAWLRKKLVNTFIFPWKNTDALEALKKPKLDFKTRFKSNTLLSHEVVKYFRIWRKQKFQSDLKRDSGTGVFPWILWHFKKNTFLQNNSGGCFWKKVIDRITDISTSSVDL